VHAALTGHLVFSTLHTNNAAGTFTRLIDLGVNPKILTSAVSLAIAQRLVRRLCEFCKEEAVLEGENLELLKRIYDKIMFPEIPFGTKIYVPHEGGCEKCNKSGYKGRIGIFEAIQSDQSIEEALETNPSEREIKKVASAQGIMDMAQDGTTKILKGMTSIEEVERVVDLKTGNGLGDAPATWDKDVKENKYGVEDDFDIDSIENK